ncbi:hypothetical protein WDV91_06520 [Curtobacterium flaccumfaciens pv. flaccumfaciens]
MTTAITNAENSPTRGSTPAMIENEIASGISARATTRPARTSRSRIFGFRRADRTVGLACTGAGAGVTVVTVLLR